MNELQAYTASIPDSNPNKAELIRQWKIDNKWGQQEVEEVVETPVEEVKTEVVAEEGVPAATTPVTSESSDSGSGQSQLQVIDENISRSEEFINSLDERRLKSKAVYDSLGKAEKIANIKSNKPEEVKEDDFVSKLISEDETGAFVLPIEVLSETNEKINSLKKQQEELSLMDPKSVKIQDEIDALESSIDPVKTASIRAEKLAKETSIKDYQLKEIENKASEFVGSGETKITKKKVWNSSTKNYVETKTVEQNEDWLKAYETAKKQYAKQNNIDLLKYVGRSQVETEFTPEMNSEVEELMKLNYIEDKSKTQTEENLENWIEDNRGVFTKSQIQNQQALYNKINAYDLSSKQKKAINTLNNSISKIDSIREEKKNITSLEFQTQEEIEEANRVYKLLDEQERELIDIYKENFEASNELLDDKNASLSRLDLLERNYSYTSNFLNSIKTAGIDLALGAEELVFRIADAPRAFNFSGDKNFNAFSPLGPLASIQMLNYTNDREDVIKTVENYKEGIEQGMAKPQSLSDLSDGQDWGRYFATTVGSQIPNTVVLIGTGGAALPIMGMTSAGSSFREMQKEMDENPLINYSPAQMYGVAALNGIAEVLSERISLGIVNRAQKAYGIDAGIKKGFVDQLKSVFTKEGFKKVGLGVVDVTGESVSEGGVEISSNIFDRYILGKEVDLFEGVADAMFSGLVMSGGVYKAPNLFKSVVNMVQGPDTNQKLSDNYSKIKETEGILAKNPKMSKKNQAILQDKIAGLVKDSSSEINKTLNRFGTLPIETIKELSAIELEQFKVRKQLEGFDGDPNMSEQAKKELVKTSKLELQELSNKKQKILEPIIKADAEVVKAGQIELNTRLKEGAGVAISQLGAGVERVDSTEDFLSVVSSLEAQGVKANVYRNEQGEVLPVEEQDYGIFARVDDGKGGFNVQLIINDASAQADGVLAADKHELLHVAAMKMDDATKVKIGKDLKSSLLNDSNLEVSPRVKKLLEAYELDLKEGKITESDFYEEVMAVVSDGLTPSLKTGVAEIKVKDISKFKAVVQKILQAIGWRQNFADGQQAINFLKDFNADVLKGEGLSEGVLSKFDTKADTEVDMGLETEVDLGDVKASKRKLTQEQDQQAQDKVKEIQDLQKESEALAEKYKKYKKDSEGNILIDEKGNPVLDPIKGAKQQRLENEFFDSEIKATIDSFVEDRTKALYDPIAASNKENVTRGQFRESMKSDIKAMVVGEFEAKQPLEKFITSRGYLRANSLAKRLGIASVEEGITKSIDDTTKQIIGEETTETVVETNDLSKKPSETTRFNKNLLTTEFLDTIKVEEAEAINEIDKDLADKKITEEEAGVRKGNVTKNVIENKITETIVEGYKGRGVAGFRDLGSPKFPIPKSVAKLYADMFGIKTVDGLTKKAQNFYPRDRDGLRQLQKFLIENSLSDYNRLPKTISDIGKATGIKQTKLGKVMYNDKGVKVGTAKQYRDIMQGKNIILTVQNGTQKDQTIEFNKPVKDISRGDLQQNLKTAWDFHTKNRALETLVPEQGKRIQAGAKFSKRLDAESKTGAITGRTLKNYTVKQLNDLGFKTLGDVKQFLGLPLLPARDIGGKKRKADKNIPLKSGYKILGGNLDLMTDAINTFLKEYPQYRGIIRKSTTSSLGRSSMGSTKIFDKLIAKSKEVYKTITRDPYKDSKRKLSKTFAKKTKEKDFLKDQYAKLDYLENYWLDVQSFIKKNPKLDFLFEQMLDDAQNDMGSLMRISPPILYLPLNSKGEIDFDVEIREEHNMPQNNVGSMLLAAAINGDVKNTFKIVSAAYMQGPLTIADDNKVNIKYGRSMPDFFWDTMVPRILSGDLKIPEGTASLIRLVESDINLDNYKFLPENKTFSEYFFGKNGLPTNIQKTLLKDFFSGDITLENAREQGLAYSELAPGMSKASKRNNNIMPKAIKYDRDITVPMSIDALAKTDKALGLARKLDQPVKKIRVFDFDDTLARSKSMVIVVNPDGTTKKINATQFAQQAADLESQGVEFDFSEFSKVVEGKKGPLFEVAKIIADKRGTEDVFILTARPQNADGPIKAFMKANGIDIPLKNITGLGDGTAEAKAGWIMGKAAEGYNDFYFADDAIKNVKAVKDVLSQIDVKSKVQLAKASKRQTFDTIVNDMIEDSSGIETYKNYSAARAKTIGANKGRFNFFIPPSAEDFTGLLYKMLGKGKKGDAQMAFLKANLLDPYDRAESAVTQAKISAANDFKALKTELKTLPTSLSVPTGIGGFTYSHAVRTAIWTAQGMEIPGLSKRDIQELNDFVQNDPELRVFASELVKIQKGKPYPKPGKDWLGGNITSDIINDINKVNRAEYQQEWRENVDIIFSEDNMNKMEAAYGTRWREAMEDSLRRMKSGSNRPPGGNRATDGILDWLNNSVGAVMFLNTRSALLQTISAVNFINWGDNNIVKAGAAFANQKQFWSDFMTLMNSDYLVERRNGLKINVSESEIADAVRDSGNKVKSAIAFLLSKGFVMTRFADSFAIATGGSTFYRNRVKSLVAKGMDQKAAEAQAFSDFRQIAEESQQSSNPNKISAQQASAAGRVILAWANTPMQYARIQKRSAQDLINGRGDWKTNVSKIVYYGAVQNLIFNALQQAVFALGFGEDDEEKDDKKNEKISRVANGMIDSQLKGLGIGGAAVLALKSTLMELGKQHAKKRPEYDEAVFDLLNFSPPLGSKVNKIRGGLRSFSWNKKEMKEKGFSLDNPSYLAGAQVVTGLTNIPLDRVAKKINNVRGMVNEESALWQKVALGLGWSTWDLGLGYYGGFDAAKVLTAEEEKVKEIDDMKKLTKTKEQVDMLLDLGLSKKEIKALGKEQNRVEKIIELQNAEAEPKKEAEVKEEIKEETKPTPTPKPKVKTVSAEARLRRQFDSIKDENKPDQVKTLLKYGLSKKEIRALQYEKNRVEKILELMPKNK